MLVKCVSGSYFIIFTCFFELTKSVPFASFWKLVTNDYKAFYHSRHFRTLFIVRTQNWTNNRKIFCLCHLSISKTLSISIEYKFQNYFKQFAQQFRLFKCCHYIVLLRCDTKKVNFLPQVLLLFFKAYNYIFKINGVLKVIIY